MESVGDFLCGIFMIMFWIFRIVVTALTFLEIEFIITSFNLQFEMILLFVNLVCIICVFKRITYGGIVYCVLNCYYFGTHLYEMIQLGVTTEVAPIVMVDFIAIIIASFVVLNILLSKTMKVSAKKDVEWFYKGKQYDRELDERADKNNYKIY